MAFVENFSLKELAAIYPEARRTPHELSFQAAAGGTVFMFPSGAVVFYDVGQAGRETELLRLRRAMPTLTSASMLEEFAVREVPGAKPDIESGCLVLDALTFERASIVALTVGQSAAMEYYERIVDQMFVKTDKIVEKLEKRGTISIFRTRALHRFIGQAIGTRSEVLSVLHLLDKPDAAWDDPAAEAHLPAAALGVRPHRPPRSAGAEAAQRAGSPGAGDRRGPRFPPPLWGRDRERGALPKQDEAVLRIVSTTPPKFVRTSSFVNRTTE